MKFPAFLLLQKEAFSGDKRRQAPISATVVNCTGCVERRTGAGTKKKDKVIASAVNVEMAHMIV